MADTDIPKFKNYAEGEPIPPVDPEDINRKTKGDQRILCCVNPKFRRVLQALFWFTIGVLTYALLVHLHRAR